MKLTNRDQVGKALDLLQAGLAPFIGRQVRHARKQRRVGTDVLRSLARYPSQAKSFPEGWDAAALLGVMLDLWDSVFKFPLGPADRSLIHELKKARNHWAHQRPFSRDEAFRALDSAEILLRNVSAKQAPVLRSMKEELLRLSYEERARVADQRRKRKARAAEEPVEGLKPWREVITPHEDVFQGRFQEAQFAADLHAVHTDPERAGSEYADPAQFFRRTHLTAGLRGLLGGAAQRLAGTGGDPVVDLQTNFGGGKTHSMLALYHLFSGTPVTSLAGVEDVLRDAGVSALPPNVKRVVLVGNRVSPGRPDRKPDGTGVRTLWGEIAWQLGGAEAYARIRTDDQRATNPGSALGALLHHHAPVLILVDEWVAYARQLEDRSDVLPAGTFETQFSFAQNLTESVKQVGNCLLVVSLPASSDSDRSSSNSADSMDEEVGGIRGRQALDRLRNVLGRVASSWKPATSEEGFEIVRRRLFQTMPAHRFKHRDQTARAFSGFYRKNRTAFPAACGEAAYRERIEAAYPIHPEVFDRLYEDWASLLRFQRTRGVLRLMAGVVHALWESNDQSPLVLPSMVPLDPGPVRSELMRYLSDPWDSILDQDVEGTTALPVRTDEANAAFGRVRAARKVARTIFLGSAPKQKAAQRGIEARRIRLGCAMPGQKTAVYQDALRKLADGGTYLYADGSRYWYATQPTVTKLARDRALDVSDDKIAQEIERRLRDEAKRRGAFAGVHVAPRDTGDVPDQREVRLVILSGNSPHQRGSGPSPAVAAASEILEKRGNGPREFQNALLFLAADRQRWDDLAQATRRMLAWKSIVEERDRLDLQPSQVSQARNRHKAAGGQVDSQLAEAYSWLLAPGKAKAGAKIRWERLPLRGGGGLVERVATRAKKDELLIPELGPSMLRREMDQVPLWDGDHVAIGKLMGYYASLLELPRVAGPQVLAETISRGLGSLSWKTDGFAWAEDYDEDEQRYVGLNAGAVMRVTEDSKGLLVHPRAAQPPPEPVTTDPIPPDPIPPDPIPPDDPPTPRPRPVRRYFGSVKLDPVRLGAGASDIGAEILQHLTALSGADVTVTLEIEASRRSGFPDRVVRIVRENSESLKFASHGFEPD